jgi:ubiquinone/menaquinone biosynthesis C-methylase UbiE
MKRENTNKIRFILEETLPPIIRDSFIFKFIIKKLYRNDKTHQKLKSKILNISKNEYKNYYKTMPQMHENSDLSEICINEIMKNIEPINIIDVGCGNGFLLKKIRDKNKKIKLNGSELTVNSKLKQNFKINNIKLYEKEIENIDQIKTKFDTVICSHVLEHVLDINKAYFNLKKICRKKLIIVVPRERPYEHTFNGHIHFFPYKWSFINTIRPKNKFIIKDLQRDFLYIEKIKN